jgi:hypothetical protein
MEENLCIKTGNVIEGISFRFDGRPLPNSYIYFLTYCPSQTTKEHRVQMRLGERDILIKYIQEVNLIQ